MATDQSSLPILTWQEFSDEFMHFAGEEQDRAIAITKGEILGRMRGLLRAYPDYKDRPAAWERGKPEQGEFLLTTPQYGIWRYNVNTGNFLERVRALVTQVGIALECPCDTDSEDFALHHLWLDLRETDSDQLWAAAKEGGIIVSVCVAFATFCSRLQRHFKNPKLLAGPN